MEPLLQVGQLYKTNKAGAKNRLKVINVSEIASSVTVQVIKNTVGKLQKNPITKVLPKSKFFGKKPSLKLVKARSTITGETTANVTPAIAAPNLGNTATY